MKNSVHNEWKANKIRVMIVDDDNSWSQSMKTFLELEGDIQVVDVAQTKDEAIEKANHYLNELDIILMDISLSPNNAEGIYASAMISEINKAKIIMLTSMEIDEYVINSFISGAVNYLKKKDYKDLPATIRKTCSGETPVEILARKFSEKAVEDELNVLTKTEKNIFDLATKGNSRKDISEKLICTLSTVKNHINSILKKLNAKSSKEAHSVLKIRAIENKKVQNRSEED
jgi:two-component system, NarL family, response regulator DevR